MVNLTINGKAIQAKEGSTILEAARLANIDIPTLCFLKDVNEVGDCRMCVVEVEGARGFATACIQKVSEGMVVRTTTFGAFVEILPGKDGLVHISKLDKKRVEKVEDVVAIGDPITVKVLEIDKMGRINLIRIVPEDGE